MLLGGSAVTRKLLECADAIHCCQNKIQYLSSDESYRQVGRIERVIVTTNTRWDTEIC
ncbi:hypothetical protein T11_11802 [Trichinella zimbabwensis]|uniref:Uncharacterized protein n=1 Tax=Trichinella zimbabwensis TaxID=268475 RepID=A0A0V1GRG4_9BILA|nr:hypothetical protein T11_11802 [Trichinella zimbabwensis]